MCCSYTDWLDPSFDDTCFLYISTNSISEHYDSYGVWYAEIFQYQTLDEFISYDYDPDNVEEEHTAEDSLEACRDLPGTFVTCGSHCWPNCEVETGNGHPDMMSFNHYMVIPEGRKCYIDT